MRKDKIIQLISDQLGVSKNQIISAITLFDEGATIPFVARYRKEMTGSLDEIILANIKEETERLDELEKRKETILKSVAEQNALTPELQAKIENRDLKDGDFTTACASVCPSNAIVFGDMNDENSEISKLFRNERSYTMLEEYNVQSSVKYLTKIRNVEGSLAGDSQVKTESAHAESTHEEAHH